MIVIPKEYETFKVSCAEKKNSHLSVVPPTGQDKMEKVANRKR